MIANPDREPRKPTRRELLRPLELVALAAVIGVFGGGVALISTRQIGLAGVAFGIAFVVALVVVAMFALTHKPDNAEIVEIDEHDHGH